MLITNTVTSLLIIPNKFIFSFCTNTDIPSPTYTYNKHYFFAEELTKEFDAVTRTLRGFRGNVYFFDDTTGEYRALNYWETKEDAENAHSMMFPELEKELKNITHKNPYLLYNCLQEIDSFYHFGVQFHRNVSLSLIS
jgi:hypothetical protein